jgi:MerR family transcriptional regulator, thiopeptide resistance regulator
VEDREEKLYTVGELARRCGVTVRTLQYYDNEGILPPKHFTEGGRRLYSKDDILALQQILFLKSFGFSLDEIRDRLLKTDSPETVREIFTRQRDALSEQIKKLQDIVEVLTRFIDETEKTGYLGAEKLVALMEMMKEGNPYSFVLRYFGQKEMKSIMKRLDIEGGQKDFMPGWQALFEEMIGLYKNGTDPEGPAGQALAAKWWEQVQKFTGGDPELLSTLISVGSDVDNWPDQGNDFKQAAKEFLGKAIEKYLKENGGMPERG